jgi:predicted nucleic acid-binding protein
MIVADTGAVPALTNADDRHHRSLRKLFEDITATESAPRSSATP